MLLRLPCVALGAPGGPLLFPIDPPLGARIIRGRCAAGRCVRRLLLMTVLPANLFQSPAAGPAQSLYPVALELAASLRRDSLHPHRDWVRRDTIPDTRPDRPPDKAAHRPAAASAALCANFSTPIRISNKGTNRFQLARSASCSSATMPSSSRMAGPVSRRIRI